MSHKAHVRHDSARHKQEELKLLEVIHICRISRCLLRSCDETNDEKNILQIKGVFCELSHTTLMCRGRYARSVRFSAKPQWYICKQFVSKVVQLGSRASLLMVLAYVFDLGRVGKWRPLFQEACRTMMSPDDVIPLWFVRKWWILIKTGFVTSLSLGSQWNDVSPERCSS